MEAVQYDRWYETPHGRWIGQREVELAVESLMPRPGESILDVGCGSGFFTRELAGRMTGPVAGVDINPEWAAYARRRDGGRASYAVADARALPFRNVSFDLVVSIAALCFIAEEIAAVREIVRVTRRRFAIGLLNRRSLLWFQKGRRGGRGGYRGARWHTVQEARSLFSGLPVTHLRVRTGVHIPAGGTWAQRFERLWPSSLPTGAFILVSGEITEEAG